MKLEAKRLLVVATSFGLVACVDPAVRTEAEVARTPETVGRMEGRKYADANRFCPAPWRDERGVVPERRDQAFYEGLYDSEETLRVLDEYMTAFQIACETQLVSPRSDV